MGTNNKGTNHPATLSLSPCFKGTVSSDIYASLKVWARRGTANGFKKTKEVRLSLILFIFLFYLFSDQCENLSNKHWQ
jgi:hypothetical protein